MRDLFRPRRPSWQWWSGMEPGSCHGCRCLVIGDDEARGHLRCRRGLLGVNLDAPGPGFGGGLATPRLLVVSGVTWVRADAARLDDPCLARIRVGAAPGGQTSARSVQVMLGYVVADEKEDA